MSGRMNGTDRKAMMSGGRAKRHVSRGADGIGEGKRSDRRATSSQAGGEETARRGRGGSGERGGWRETREAVGVGLAILRWQRCVMSLVLVPLLERCVRLYLHVIWPESDAQIPSRLFGP